MSPLDTCIFCKIALGTIPSAKVWEDARVVAFLDIQPLARGHALVVPKAHARLVEELTREDAEALWRAAGEVSRKVRHALGAPATTIAVNNGPEAGQEVPHVHVHVVPRTKGDQGGPIHAIMPGRPTVAQHEFDGLATVIRSA